MYIFSQTNVTNLRSSINNKNNSVIIEKDFIFKSPTSTLISSWGFLNYLLKILWNITEVLNSIENLLVIPGVCQMQLKFIVFMNFGFYWFILFSKTILLMLMMYRKTKWNFPKEIVYYLGWSRQTIVIVYYFAD